MRIELTENEKSLLMERTQYYADEKPIKMWRFDDSVFLYHGHVITRILDAKGNFLKMENEKDYPLEVFLGDER